MKLMLLKTAYSLKTLLFDMLNNRSDVIVDDEPCVLDGENGEVDAMDGTASDTESHNHALLLQKV